MYAADILMFIVVNYNNYNFSYDAFIYHLFSLHVWIPTGEVVDK